MVDKEIIELVKKYLSKLDFDYKEAWLFGSYAKGNYHQDSDVDVAIIFEESQITFDSNFKLLNLRDDSELMIEPHSILTSDFNKYNSLANEILKYGIKIN